VDTQGAAVAGAHVKLVSASGDPIGETESDSQGFFRFANVPAGKFQLTASSQLFASVPEFRDATYPTPIERVVGVPLKSYITLTWTYHFGR
jgi:hypothetical protein